MKQHWLEFDPFVMFAEWGCVARRLKGGHGAGHNELREYCWFELTCMNTNKQSRLQCSRCVSLTTYADMPEQISSIVCYKYNNTHGLKTIGIMATAEHHSAALRFVLCPAAHNRSSHTQSRGCRHWKRSKTIHGFVHTHIALIFMASASVYSQRMQNHVVKTIYESKALCVSTDCTFRRFVGTASPWCRPERQRCLFRSNALAFSTLLFLFCLKCTLSRCNRQTKPYLWLPVESQALSRSHLVFEPWSTR